MQEGESELGGLKIPHGNTTPPSSTPGSQPAASATEKSGADPSVASNYQPITPIPSVSATTTASTVSTASANQSAPTSPTPVVQPTTQSTSQSTQVNQTVQRPQFTTPVSSRPLSTEVSQQASKVQSGGIERNIQGFASLRPTSETPPADSFAQQFISSATDSAVNDVILTTTKSKRWKKWVVGGVVGVVAIILGAVILFMISPFRSVPTKDEYRKLYEELVVYDIKIQDFQDFIKKGLNEEINFYQLFILGYITEKEGINSLFDNGSLGGSEMAIPESIITGNNDADMNNFDNYLKNIQKLKVDDDIKNAAKEIQGSISEYVKVSDSFSEKMHSLREIFINSGEQDMEKFLDDHKFPVGVKYTLLSYKKQYDEISSSWEKCQDNPTREECRDILSTNILEIMDEDFDTVRNIFNKFINDEELEFITQFSLESYGLTKKIGGLHFEN